MIVVYLWIALALLGLYASHLNGIEAIRDFQAVESKTNGRRTIAVGNLRREVVRGLIQFDFLIIGIFSLLGHSGLVVPGLFLASGGMVLNSWLDRRDLRYLLTHGFQSRDEQGRFTK